MWTSKFVPGGVSSLAIQTWNHMRNSQAQNTLLLSLKTTHQMDDSAIKKISESDIVMPRTEEELFRALEIKSGIFRCFLSYERLVLRKLSDATEMIQRTRNKIEVLAITDTQVYTRILYRIDKQFNDWVQDFIMYPTDLDAIDWEMIDFREIISNVNNMYFQSGPIPPSFRTLNITVTKTTKGPSNNDHSKEPSIKKGRKTKGSKEQNESTLSECKLRDTKELINFS